MVVTTNVTFLGLLLFGGLLAGSALEAQEVPGHPCRESLVLENGRRVWLAPGYRRASRLDSGQMLIYCDNTRTGRRRFLCGACGQEGCVHNYDAHGYQVTHDLTGAGFFDLASGRILRVELRPGPEHFVLRLIADLDRNANDGTSAYTFGAHEPMVYDVTGGALLTMLGTISRDGMWFARVDIHSGSVARVKEFKTFRPIWDLSDDLTCLYVANPESTAIEQYGTGDGALVRRLMHGLFLTHMEVNDTKKCMIGTKVTDRKWQGIWMVDMESETQRLVNPQGHHASWRPATRDIAFLQGGNQLWYASALDDQGNAVQSCLVEFAQPDGAEHLYFSPPTWSADGRYLTVGLSAWLGEKHFSSYEHWGILVDLYTKHVLFLPGLHQGLTCMESSKSRFGARCGAQAEK